MRPRATPGCVCRRIRKSIQHTREESVRAAEPSRAIPRVRGVLCLVNVDSRGLASGAVYVACGISTRERCTRFERTPIFMRRRFRAARTRCHPSSEQHLRRSRRTRSFLLSSRRSRRTARSPAAGTIGTRLAEFGRWRAARGTALRSRSRAAPRRCVPNTTPCDRAALHRRSSPPRSPDRRSGCDLRPRSSSGPRGPGRQQCCRRSKAPQRAPEHRCPSAVGDPCLARRASHRQCAASDEKHCRRQRRSSRRRSARRARVHNAYSPAISHTREHSSDLTPCQTRRVVTRSDPYSPR